MQTRSYNKELRNYTAQFIDLFNDIVIDRRDANGKVQKTFKVPCVYGGRRRVLKKFENRDGNVPLPLIVVNITGMHRDQSRSFAIHDDLLMNDGTGNLDPMNRTPAPIDINYSVEIIGKYQDDIDMIIGNFVPYFLPNLYVVAPNPYNDSNPLKLYVGWDGDLNMDFESETSSEEDERIVVTTSFTLKGWLFPGMGVRKTSKIIKRINFNQNLGNETVTLYSAKRGAKFGATYSPTYYTKYIGMESNFYAVPSATPFETFRAAILSGYVSSGAYDHLAITAGVEGYWQDISGARAGTYSLAEIASSDWNIVKNEDDNLILFKGKYLNADMQDISFDAWWEFHKSTVSGDLSSYYG